MSVSKVIYRHSNHFLHFFLSFLFDKLNAFVLLLQGVVEKAAGIGQVCKAIFIPLSLFIFTRCMGEKKNTHTQRKKRYFQTISLKKFSHFPSMGSDDPPLLPLKKSGDGGPVGISTTLFRAIGPPSPRCQKCENSGKF